MARFQDAYSRKASRLMRQLQATRRRPYSPVKRFPPRCQATIVLSVEAVMALAPDDAALAKTREVAQQLGFQQVVLFTHDRASDETLGLLADRIIAEF